MKITTVLCTFMVMLLALTSCAQKKQTDMSEQTNGKTLVAYFSATGNTRKAAKQLADVMGATLHEITPEQPYTSEDLDWTDSTSRSYVEMHNLESRPAISDKVDNLSEYDTVFLGFPVWWYVAPTVVNTFIENNDLDGKTVICFATSGGSPVGPCVDALKKQYPNIEWKEGKLLNDVSREELQTWKEELGL